MTTLEFQIISLVMQAHKLKQEINEIVLQKDMDYDLLIERKQERRAVLVKLWERAEEYGRK
jgi:hypothetical protein